MEHTTHSSLDWQAFWAGDENLVVFTGNEATCVAQLPQVAVLPGSFNPLHFGHRQLAAVAARLSGLPVMFEIAVMNVDKPMLSPSEVLHRLVQFNVDNRVAVTRAATFLEKAQLFPQSLFVIGYDTAARILDPTYYPQQSPEAMIDSLLRIKQQDCKFLVGCRLQDHTLHTLYDLTIPDEFANIFEAIPVEQFRVDISSTLLRKQQAGKKA